MYREYRASRDTRHYADRLEKCLRVAIDLQPQSTSWLTMVQRQVANQGPQRGRAVALEQEMPPPAPSNAIDGTRGRTDDVDIRQGVTRGDLSCRFSRAVGSLGHPLLAGARDDQVREATVRRVSRSLAVGDFTKSERLVVVLQGGTKSGVLRSCGLDQDLARLVTTSGTTRDLCQQLERALSGPEVRQVESNICVDYADERDSRKIQSLGDHLGAEKNIHLGAPDFLQQSAMRALASGRVDIHAEHTRGRKELGDALLDLLGADAGENELGFPARVALSGNLILVSAVMTYQPIARPMKGE